MCSGVGACRKTLTGNMCPSYMVTRDEADSTRGRANALRLAMAGDLGEAGLSDEGVFTVLELCLECRACKSECPVGVDMARFKSEFLASYWKQHGTPLKARILGNANRLARLGSLMPALANATMGLVRGLAGVHPDRTLPQLSSQTLTHWFRNRPSVRQPSVLLFNDTWTNYYQPVIGLAATKVLSAAGQSVSLAPNVCCGRPLISQGFLRMPVTWRSKILAFYSPPLVPARSSSSASQAAFLQSARMPRCLCVVNCAPKLKKWPPPASCSKTISSGSLSPVAPPWLSDPDQPRFCCTDTATRKPWDYSKAPKPFWAGFRARRSSTPTPAVAAWPDPSATRKEKYDVSRKIANRKLLPAIRGLKSGTPVVAAGFSCRHQVQDFLRRIPNASRRLAGESFTR